MSAPAVSRERFAQVWQECGGSPQAVANLLGIGIRSVYERRAKMAKDGVILKTTPSVKAITNTAWQMEPLEFPKRRSVECYDGYVCVGSDLHIWPNEITTAHKAFLKVIERLRPQFVILNGDVLDGARISRHDPMCWEEGRPTLKQELEACADRLAEIRAVSPNANHFFTIGNHDSRLERYLAMRAPEVHGIPGSALRDHFPGWDLSWSVMINEKTHPVMVKHALKGGVHAVYNNTLHSGISIVTGHLHAQLCRPFTDYRGTRYGVDCGTMADIHGNQFAYTLDNPVNWRSGFAVLRFDDEGRLYPPALCEVQQFGEYERAVFQGEVIVECP